MNQTLFTKTRNVIMFLCFTLFSSFWYSTNAQVIEDFENLTNQNATQAFLGSGTWSLNSSDVSTTVSAGSGSNSLHLQGNNPSTATTPLIKNARGSGTITFSAITNSTNSNNGFEVEYSTNGTSFTSLGTITPSSTSNFNSYSVSYNINSDFYIRFTRNNRQFWIDNISIASCNAIPTALTSSSVANTSATIGWTGVAASGFDYYYSTSNITPNASTMASGSTAANVKSANLTGLATGTTYYYWVRGKCGVNSISNWSQIANFTTLSSSCSGTPTAGTTILTPSTGAPSSAFVATITGSSSGSGLSYQWQMADAVAGTYTDISGQTGATANLTAIPLPGTTKYYRRKITCSASGLSTVSVGVPFTTTTPTYCTPTTSSPGKTYIKSFKFVGTLNDPALSANVTGASGYANYTTLTPIAQQPDGKVMNIEAISDGTIKVGTSFGNGNWKAYVDWNGDGDFVDAGEEVYSLTGFVTNALTFGFVIPAGQAPGKYRFRIIVNNDSGSFNSCSSFTNGEIEDYSFEVVYNCPATVDAINIVAADGHRCGTGTVNLSASGTGTNYKWYTTLTGGSAIFTGSNYTTASLSTTTVYYVTAINGTCESAYRIPITARIDPEPVVNITTPAPICGTGFSGVQLTSSGDQYVDTIVDEKFDSGLGLFTSSTIGAYTGTSGTWQNRPSPYIPTVPPYEGLAPALSSGYFGGNYAAIITDIDRSTSILNALTLTSNQNLTNFQDLRLDFDLYYFSITNLASEGYLKVEYSLDGGGNWTTLSTITSIQGNPNTWNKFSIPIPGPYVSTQFKIRFLLFAYAENKTGNSWKESITTVDNIKVYGSKPITTGFLWSGPANTLYESTCTTLIGATRTNSICIKPSATQIENDASWSITATANFANGCPATKTIVVQNDTKTWDSASSDWNTTNWKPSSSIPNADKCVIIKKPVSLVNGNGFAKNITIQQGGSLNIKKDRTLTVTDYVKNETTTNNEDQLVLESDANLIQINGTAANSGKMTAMREVIGLVNDPAGRKVDYVYWSSPVAGQITKGTAPGAFSPGTPNNRFFYYLESNDRFYETGDPTFRLGRGYAVQAEANQGPFPNTAPYTKNYLFKGTPNNGDISFNIIKSSAAESVHGYNLVGNPYPSNIKFEELYAGNSALIYNTAWFWTNATYEQYQQGSSYSGNNYAVYNGTGGTAATQPNGVVYSSKKPNGIIKVGQGFLVQKKVLGTDPLNFKHFYTSGNKLRVSDSGEFFQKDAGAKNRFWLNLLSPSDLVNSQLIGYVAGATDEYEKDYDAEAFSLSSDLFYSAIPGKKLLIQGKSEAFTNEDKITLGANFFQNGTYTIALENAEGIFDGSQNIYLKDKQEGIITNLSQGSYTFIATKADNATRFEIIYKPEAVLATGGSAKNQIIVYRDGTDFVIKSPQALKNVEVYDNSGKLIIILKPNDTTAILDASAIPNGGYILKIKSKEGVIVSRKIVR